LSDDAYSEILSKIKSTSSNYKDFTQEEVPLTQSEYDKISNQYPRYLVSKFQTNDGKEAEQVSSDNFIAIMEDGNCYQVSGKQNHDKNSQENLRSKNIEYNRVKYIVAVRSSIIRNGDESNTGLTNTLSVIIYKK